MKRFYELEAEAIVNKMNIDELREAAKCGVMFSLLLYGRLFRIVRDSLCGKYGHLVNQEAQDE